MLFRSAEMRVGAATQAGHDAAAFHRHDRDAEVPELQSAQRMKEHVVLSLHSGLFLYPRFRESFDKVRSQLPRHCHTSGRFPPIRAITDDLAAFAFLFYSTSIVLEPLRSNLLIYIARLPYRSSVLMPYIYRNHIQVSEWPSFVPKRGEVCNSAEIGRAHV